MRSKHNVKFNNLAGQVFGKLKVLNDFVFQHNHRKWLCKCSCGNEIYALATNLLRNKTHSCGCLAKDIIWFQTGEKHPKWKGAGEISGKKWSILRLGAKAREIEFNLSVKDAWDMFEKQNRKCVLTGWDIKINETASLDRINSSKGYTKDNVQWVHKDINLMKLDHTQEYFVQLCKAVANFARI